MAVNELLLWTLYWRTEYVLPAGENVCFFVLNHACLTGTYYYLSCLYMLFILWSLPTWGCFFRPFVKKRLVLTHRAPRVARPGAAHRLSRVLPRSPLIGLVSGTAGVGSGQPKQHPSAAHSTIPRIGATGLLLRQPSSLCLGGVPPTENLLEYLMLLCRAVKKHSFAIFTYYGWSGLCYNDWSLRMNRFRVGVDFFHCKSFSGLIFLAEESLSGGLCDLSLRYEAWELQRGANSLQQLPSFCRAVYALWQNLRNQLDGMHGWRFCFSSRLIVSLCCDS